MAVKEKFEKMLTPERFRRSAVKPDSSDGRTAFDSDYSRIVISSPLRRLQDKAQVFPLEQSDFIRTRLTHSLEVACFAKGLGLGVEKILCKKGLISKITRNEHHISKILEVAGLVHDIGNPPFGHFGEKSISCFFEQVESDNFPNTEIHEAFMQMTEQQREDFKHFDGNVQGFRILRRLGLSEDEYSFNLSKPVLSTIIKYPYDSVNGNKEGQGHSRSRFGYFQSEAAEYRNIIQALGLNEGQRHPLTYLLEAADDIAYSVSDIEDGYRMGIISFDSLKKAFSDADQPGALVGYTKYLDRMDVFIQKLRIKSQTKMLVDCTNTFCEKFEEMVNDTYNGEELLHISKSDKLRKAFQSLAVLNYSDKTVLKRELLGEKVISGLMQTFVTAIFDANLLKAPNKFNTKTKSYKLYSLISDNLKKVSLQRGEIVPADPYRKFQLVIDFVSGMTDSYAVSLYNELNP